MSEVNITSEGYQDRYEGKSYNRRGSGVNWADSMCAGEFYEIEKFCRDKGFKNPCSRPCGSYKEWEEMWGGEKFHVNPKNSPIWKDFLKHAGGKEIYVIPRGMVGENFCAPIWSTINPAFLLPKK